MCDEHSCAHPAVYPRVCGGSGVPLSTTMTACGLSPRVRGKQTPLPTISMPPGSIPACAGEARPRPYRRIAGRVYPRVCGGSPSFLPR